MTTLQVYPHTLEALSQSLKAHWAQATSPVTLNLEAIERLDYRGVQALVRCLRQAVDHVGTLYLDNLNPAPRQVLEITRTLQLFQVAGEKA